MQRRFFIKTTCSAGAAILLTDVISIGLSGCKVTGIYSTTIKDKKIVVPVKLFAENPLQIIRAKELDYDIALRKEPDGSFNALLMRCTHAENSLMSTGNGFFCDAHGSKFDKEGLVLKGPAEYSLKNLTTEIVSNNIIIHTN